MSFLTAFTLKTRNLTYDEPYYEYVRDLQQWCKADEWCKQRYGALATISTQAEKQNLTSFLKSLNISQPVWIAKNVMTHQKSRCPVPFLKLYLDLLAPFIFK